MKTTTPINDVFNYRLLRREIKKTGMKIPEWLEQHGMLAYRTQLRYKALSLVKLRDIMEVLELPVPYFFTEYQEQMAELGYVMEQAKDALQAAEQLPESSTKSTIISKLEDAISTVEQGTIHTHPEPDTP